jgi:hypothetical protein
MREHILAVIVAVATFGVVNGAIVGVGLATTEPADTVAVFAIAKPAPVLRAEIRAVRVKAPS